MRLFLALLLTTTLCSALRGQGFAVRSDGGAMTNGAFYGLSTFRGVSGTLRLYGEASTANRKDFRLSSGSDLLSFIWLNDAGNSALILGSVDALGNWSFTGDATALGSVSATRFIGSASNLTVIATTVLTNTIGVSIDGGGAAIVAGRYGNYLTVPYDCTIIGVRFMGDHNGTATMDIWKTNWAGYPPTVASSITASAKPTLTATNRVQDLVLTGWTTNVTAGDVFAWNVDSSATFTNLTLQLLLRH